MTIDPDDLRVPVGGTVARLTVAKKSKKIFEDETDLKKTDFGDPERAWLFQLAWTCPFCGGTNETGCAARAICGEYEETCGQCHARVVNCRPTTCEGEKK